MNIYEFNQLLFIICGLEALIISVLLLKDKLMEDE